MKSTLIIIIINVLLTSEISAVQHVNIEKLDVTCYHAKCNGSCKTIPRVKGLKKIFFIETSCTGGINSRQACAIESAARANPEWTIFVLYVGPFKKSFEKGKTFKTLKSYTNVLFRRLNLTKYTENTPLELLFEDEAYKISPYAAVHCSDLLRILTLWKYGGVYLDLDMIVQKPFDDLPKDFVTKQHYSSIKERNVGSAVIGVSKSKAGRKFANLVLRHLSIGYNPWSWAVNTNGVYTMILEKMCNTKNIYMMNEGTCGGFHVIGNEYFFPIELENHENYFKNNNDELFLSEFNDTYAFHVWNSHTRGISPEPNCFLVQLAKKLCPKIYNIYNKDFGAIKNTIAV